MAKPDFRYVDSKFQAATPEELTIITFDILIASTTSAITNLKAPKLNVQAVHNDLRRAQGAAVLLMGSLKMEVDAGLGREIFRVYEFWYHELFMANMKKSPAIIEQLLPDFKEYRATWTEAHRRLRSRSQNAALASATRAEGSFVAFG